MTRLLPQWLVMFCCCVAVPAFAHLPGAGGADKFIQARIRINESAIIYDLEVEPTLVEAMARLRMRDPNHLNATEEERYRAAIEEAFLTANAVTVDGIRVFPVLEELTLAAPGEPLKPPADSANPAPPAGAPGNEAKPAAAPSAMTDDQGNGVSTGDSTAKQPTDVPIPPHMRIRLRYPLKSMPSRVAIVWDWYPRSAKAMAEGTGLYQSVPAELSVAGQRKFIVFRSQEPEFVWHARAEGAALPDVLLSATDDDADTIVMIPGITAALLCLAIIILVMQLRSPRWPSRRLVTGATCVLICAVAGAATHRGLIPTPLHSRSSPAPPTTAEAKQIFRALHTNVYRAFDYERPSDIYDVLSQSVDGSLLESIYNEIYQSLILREEGGAVCGIQSVDVQEADVEFVGRVDDDGDVGFRVNTEWQVHGAVSHWGHSHFRTNAYHARQTVARRGDAWKIIDIEILSHRRVDPKLESPKSPPLPVVPGPSAP